MKWKFNIEIPVFVHGQKSKATVTMSRNVSSGEATETLGLEPSLTPGSPVGFVQNQWDSFGLRIWDTFSRRLCIHDPSYV